MEDRDLVRLEGKVDALAVAVNAMAVSVGAIGVNVEHIHDHEQRIRAVERFRFAFPSMAAISTLAAVAAVLIAVFVH